MAGKAKSCYLSVTDNTTRKVVFTKVFFAAGDMNKYIKTPEFLEQFPADKFTLTKETY